MKIKTQQIIWTIIIILCSVVSIFTGGFLCGVIHEQEKKSPKIVKPVKKIHPCSCVDRMDRLSEVIGNYIEMERCVKSWNVKSQK